MDETRRWIVEHDEIDEGRGLRLVVVFSDLGHRCGYVGVHRGHILFGESYDYVESNFDSIRVHGGLTYSGHDEGYPVHNEQDDWWFFGFDCMHYHDAPDFESIVRYGIGDTAFAMMLTGAMGGTPKSYSYVVNECCNLANQLADIHPD